MIAVHEDFAKVGQISRTGCPGPQLWCERWILRRISGSDSVSLNDVVVQQESREQTKNSGFQFRLWNLKRQVVGESYERKIL